MTRQVVVIIISGATSDEKVGIKTTFGFHCNIQYMHSNNQPRTYFISTNKSNTATKETNLGHFQYLVVCFLQRIQEKRPIVCPKDEAWGALCIFTL